ncbi:MAG: gliding motility-associated C-terminal domain-containing protein [Bacteroidia bacterium]
MKNLIHTLLLLTLFYTTKAQMLYYQNTYKGGASFDGNTYCDYQWYNADTINFQNSVPTGCNLKKAFLISTKISCGFVTGNYPKFDIPVFSFIYNNHTIQFDTTDNASPIFYTTHNQMWMAVKDVTSLTQNNSNTLIQPCQSCLINTCDYYNYLGFYLLLLYENSTYGTVNVVLYLNNDTYTPVMNYLFNVNSINTSNDVGLSIENANTNTSPYLTYQLSSLTNTVTLGTLRQQSLNHDNDYKTGLGSFHYENGILGGLVDDSPDAFIDTTDALANVNTYLPNNANSFTITSNTSNVISENFTTAFIMAYNTPCPNTPANADSIKVYKFCTAASTQLQATSGYANYNWQPSAGLSNSNIANPTVNTNNNTNYICSVTDAAGCTHTEHAQVIIHQAPTPQSLTTTTAICGDIQGTLSIIPNIYNYGYTYSLNNGSAQTATTFSNLVAGQYTLTIKDTALNCTYAKTFSITQVNPAHAAINAQPIIGLVPLTTSFQDYDFANTTNTFNWYVDNNVLQGKNITYTFNTPGSYSVTLIAYNNLPACADTSYITIVVEDSLLWFMPNVFTPNGDARNDMLSITPYYYKNISWQILNRWGKEMINKQQDIDANNPQVILWDGKEKNQLADDGTYYYIINLIKTNNTQKTLKGFVTLIK